jgi:hypothetical protein
VRRIRYLLIVRSPDNIPTCFSRRHPGSDDCRQRARRALTLEVARARIAEVGVDAESRGASSLRRGRGRQGSGD